MTKTKLKTSDGKWFKDFHFNYNGNHLENVDVELSTNESDAMICGKTEASERIKTARIHCGIELIQVSL